MTDLTKIIQEKVKLNQVIFGYNQVIKAVKLKNPELVVIANNAPKEKKDTIEHNAKIARISVKNFENDSVNLGLICGKPFPVNVLAIKGSQK